MTPNAGNRLMNTMLRIHQLLVETYLPQLERGYEAARGLPPHSLSGRGRELSNEAQARTYVIDPILNELGWKVEETGRSIVEAPAESNVSGEHRRFLDYFGREATGENVRSLLVVEAKRLSLALPNGAAGQPPNIVVINAIRTHLADPENSLAGLDTEWHKILQSIVDYVRRLEESAELGAPKVFLLTNGDWFITLLKPAEIFAGDVNPNNVFVSENLEAAASQAHFLQEHLAYENLCDNIPPQHWSSLQHFMVGADIENPLLLSWAVEVVNKPWPGVQPLIGMTIVANIRVPNGGWVRFRSREDEDDRVTLLKDGQLDSYMDALSDNAETLLSQLSQYAAFKEISATEFEASIGATPTLPSTSLLSFEGKYNYVWHLGQDRRPFLAQTPFDECSYHAHNKCNDEGAPAYPAPILAKSMSPVAYFVNASPMHCAHKVAQANRETRCQVNALDEFLCCHRCALHQRCWPSGLGSFPCNEGH